MKHRTCIGLLVGLCLFAIVSAGATRIPKVPIDDVICFALYTVHEDTLKLTAQLYPLEDGAPRTVLLQIERGGAWETVAETEVIEPGWTAPFRVAPWDAAKRARYRVAYNDTAFYEGVIQRDPVDKNPILVAAFTGNSIHPQHGGDIPKKDIVENIKRIAPDLLFFSGDQVYNHKQHLAAWLKFGRDFGEIIRNTPTVTIPDDHDVGQANLWGEAGKKSTRGSGDDGGYFMDSEYVKMVERAQTSHLPDPYDPTPVGQGIGVYYTGLRWGRVSFAVIEDRKWKTGPAERIPQRGPRPDHITDPTVDPASVDVPGLKLLGERQLAFLRAWGEDWKGADMKAVLSQTVFCGGAHLHGKHDARLIADLDSNGWPQAGRNRALREIRKAFATMLCGDQHLATIIHHGIDDWNDAGYSFCVPSIANLYLRWWDPPEPGKNRGPGMPEHTGEFLDGFGNKLTMWAVANPAPGRNAGNKLTTRAAGFGIIAFDKDKREITFTCWPRNIDITAPGAQPYPGWPKTVKQQENYGRKAFGHLPTIVSPSVNFVVQVVQEATGETLYTLRSPGKRYRPKVFAPGRYTVYVGEGADRVSVPGLRPVRDPAAELNTTRPLESTLAIYATPAPDG